MYGLQDYELARLEIHERLRQAERVHMVSRALREREASRRRRAAEPPGGPRILVRALTALHSLLP